MSDPIPPSTPAPAPVATTDHHLCRLWTFTYINLGLNVVILVLLLAGLVLHHLHHKHHRFAQDRMGAWPHHFQGQGGGGFGGPGPAGGPIGAAPSGPAPGPGAMPNMGGMRGMLMGGHMGLATADPAKISDGLVDFLSNALTLTDDQKAKIKPIIEQQVTQMQKQMEAEHAAMQKQMEDAKAQIRALLTPDQQKAFDALPIPGQKPAEAK